MNTEWEKVKLSAQDVKIIRGYTAYSRTVDGSRIFQIVANTAPAPRGTGGYYDLYAAAKAKGVL